MKKRILAFALTMAMVASVLAGLVSVQGVQASTTNYVDVVQTYQVGDIVTYGNYWQNDTNGDGTADKNDEKEPIEWRVLSNDGDDLFLMATKGLDAQPYNETRTDVTWETCTLRTWLNDEFYNNAFSASEQNAIKITTLENEDNPAHGTDGGNSTNDKVFLLSLSDVINTSYGFSSSYSACDENMQIKATEYALNSGALVSTLGKCNWWLRLMGYSSRNASFVESSGDVNMAGSYLKNTSKTVCPALHLDLKSVNQMPEIINTETPGETPTPSATVSATPTPSATASASTASPSATAEPTASTITSATVQSTATASATTSATAAPTTEPTTEPTVEPSKKPATKKSIKFTKKSVKIKKGKKATLKVKIKGAKKAKFTTNKKKVAKIVKAKAKKVTIKGVKKGKAVITAKAAGKKAKCKVTVK